MQSLLVSLLPPSYKARMLEKEYCIIGINLPLERDRPGRRWGILSRNKKVVSQSIFGSEILKSPYHLNGVLLKCMITAIEGIFSLIKFVFI